MSVFKCKMCGSTVEFEPDFSKCIRCEPERGEQFCLR